MSLFSKTIPSTNPISFKLAVESKETPSHEPTVEPREADSTSSLPTDDLTPNPSPQPTEYARWTTPKPSVTPTTEPTMNPTLEPTALPTSVPTFAPSDDPTPAPSDPMELFCGDDVPERKGDFDMDDETLTFEVRLAHRGQLVLDARH